MSACTETNSLERMRHPLLCSYTPSATVSAVPRPNITRHQIFGSALTGLVVIGVNKSNTIWCSARNRVTFMGLQNLRILFWVYNGKRLPTVNRGESSDFDVYMERYAGSSAEDNMLRGSELFTSREHSLLLLGTIRVSPLTVGIYTLIKVWTFKFQVSEVYMWLPRLTQV